MTNLGYPQEWFMAEAKGHIDMGLFGFADPKKCGLIAIKWMVKALTR